MLVWKKSITKMFQKQEHLEVVYIPEPKDEFALGATIKDRYLPLVNDNIKNHTLAISLVFTSSNI